MEDKKTFIAITLGTLALLLAEIYMGSFTIFALKAFSADLLSLSVFGGIAVGNMIGLHFWVRNWSLGWDWLLVALLQILTFIFCRWGYEWGSLWIALPFVGYGICFSRLFSSYSLKTLIVALGVSGIILGFIYFFLIQFFPLEIQWLTVLIPLLTALLFSGKMVKPALALFIIASSFHFSGLWSPRPRLSRLSPDVAKAMPYTPPRINALFRTDLLNRSNNEKLYMLNGIRFGAIPSIQQTEKSLLGGEPRYITHELPYFFVKPKNVLVIGAAEGRNVVAALRHRAEHITAVDINPHVFDIFNEDLPEIGKLIYFRPEVTPVVVEGRNYLSQTDQKFDLITLQGVHAETDVTAGEFLKIESYLFTQEALLSAWNRLTENGALFIDDYDFVSIENKKLFHVFSDFAAKEFGFEDPQKHIVQINYTQSSKVPALYLNKQKVRRGRTGLILSKKPLEISHETKKMFAEAEFPIEDYIPEKTSSLMPTDNQPVFFTMNLVDFEKVLFWCFCVGALLMIAFILHQWGVREMMGPPGYLALTGIGYIMLVSGLSGKLFLWLGHPAYVAPVLFTTLYTISLVGGLWVMQASRRQTVIVTTGFFVLAAVLVFFDQKVSTALMSLGPLKFAVVIFIIVVFAMLTEGPYIFGLKQYEGVQCASANAIEHLGNLIGAPLAILIQLNYGYQALFLSALGLFLVVLLLMALRVSPSSPKIGL